MTFQSRLADAAGAVEGPQSCPVCTGRRLAKLGEVCRGVTAVFVGNSRSEPVNLEKVFNDGYIPADPVDEQDGSATAAWRLEADNRLAAQLLSPMSTRT